jgi:hypothetical protein
VSGAVTLECVIADNPVTVSAIGAVPGRMFSRKVAETLWRSPELAAVETFL